MPKSLPHYLLALLLFALPVLAGAAPATYSGQAPVSSQSEADRVVALRTALAGVVARLTGDSAVLTRPDVASALGQAERYVLQYQYRADTGGAGAAPHTGYLLIAEFDSRAVDAMLLQLGLATGAETAGDDSAPVIGAPSEAQVWIGGIRSPIDYAHTLAYLSGLEGVRDVQPLQARGDGMLVKLSLGAGLAYFLGMIGDGGTLTVVNDQAPVDGVSATLAYIH